jgi:cysteine synthase B
MKKVGNTDMVELKKYQYKNVHIYAKLEMQNPGGSIKDRVGMWLIDNALVLGKLKDGDTIIEATSGNTGIGVALTAKEYKIKCILYVPSTTAKEKIARMKSYGAEIKLIDGTIDTCIGIVDIISETHDNLVWLNQFDNLASVECHNKTTAPEIHNWMFENVYDCYNQLNVLVSAMGTTGTIMGCSKFLKQYGWKIFGVMPDPNCKIEGLKNLNIQRVPKIYNKEALDCIIGVTDIEAIEMMKDLYAKEGIMAGPSSGAALSAAMFIAKRIQTNKKPINIVVILPDSGKNYVSSGVWK